MEEINDLKRKMTRVIINREEMPKEVMHVIKNAFVEMENMCKEFNKGSNTSIQQYIEGKYEEVKHYINKYIESTRKGDQLNEIQIIFGRMKRSIEEQKEDEDKIREENMYKQEFLSVQGKNGNYALGIMEILRKEMINIQSRQNHILNAREFSANRIDEINDQILYFIRTFENQNGQKVFDALQEDDKLLQQELLSQYEKYLEQSKVTDRQKFKEGLSANIIL